MSDSRQQLPKTQENNNMLDSSEAQQTSKQTNSSDIQFKSFFASPPSQHKTQNILALQGIIGNQAVQRLIDQHKADVIQRDLDSDIMDSVILNDWSQAVTLLNQLNDTDLSARIAQQSPEALLGLQRAAQTANVTRVTQAIQQVQLGSGTQVDTFEGSTFRNPVSLFRSGVMVYKEVRFVRRGNFASDADFETFKNRVMEAVRVRLTNRYRLKIETPNTQQPQQGDGEYPIRIQFIENPSASYRIQLFGQRHGGAFATASYARFFERGDATETEESETTMAHECAHILLGAHDEYADASFSARPTFTDHSLMGNYPSEGETQAQLKPRHFGALVQLVGNWFPGRDISII
jgi:hypothetical protein